MPRKQYTKIRFHGFFCWDYHILRETFLTLGNFDHPLGVTRCSPYWQPVDVAHHRVISTRKKTTQKKGIRPTFLEMSCTRGGDGGWRLETNGSGQNNLE